MRAWPIIIVLFVMFGFASCDEKPPVEEPVKKPELTAFTPQQGRQGTLISISGKNFGNNASLVSVSINGLAATVITVSDTEITALVPDKCGLGNVVVKVGTTEFATSDKFRYLYQATTSYLTGGGKGYVDGAAQSVKFEAPYNIAFDSKGLLYTADLGNCMIRKIDPDGTTSTVVGTPRSGFQDGKGDQALMKFPIGVDIGPDDVIYIADHQNNAIRKVSTDGSLTTISGGPDKEGLSDGNLANAKFKRPYGVKLDAVGVLWICDTENALIRKIGTDGNVTTFAGSTQGYADGSLREAKFYFPAHLAFDGLGNVFVADKHNHCIRKISKEGQVTTFAGKAQQLGFADGAAGQAMFNQPSNVQIDGLGNLYVTDLYNHCIRLVYPDGFVTTLAGQPGISGYKEGKGTEAQFYHPQGSVLDKSGNLFVTDSYNNRIRKLTIE